MLRQDDLLVNYFSCQRKLLVHPMQIQKVKRVLLCKLNMFMLTSRQTKFLRSAFLRKQCFLGIFLILFTSLMIIHKLFQNINVYMQNILNSSNLKLNKRKFCLKYGSRLNCNEMLARAQKNTFFYTKPSNQKIQSFSKRRYSIKLFRRII